MTSDVSEHIREVDGRLTSIHRVRLAELGRDGSGLFDHYSMLLEEGGLVRPYEADVFRFLIRDLEPWPAYCVLRAGLGELALLLHRAGLWVVACEPNDRRFSALTASVEALLSDRRDEMHLFPAFLPTSIERRPALGIFLDFVFDLDLEGDAAFRRELRQFDAVLVCPRLFVRLRQTPAEQQSVIGFLRSLGFTVAREVPDLELVFMERRHGSEAVTTEPRQEAVRVAERAQPQTYEWLVERVMDFVPPVAASAPGSTWIDRRRGAFNMDSALGDGE